jgi:hypothetical protein
VLPECYERRSGQFDDLSAPSREPLPEPAELDAFVIDADPEEWFNGPWRVVGGGLTFRP